MNFIPFHQFIMLRGQAYHWSDQIQETKMLLRYTQTYVQQPSQGPIISGCFWKVVVVQKTIRLMKVTIWTLNGNYLVVFIKVFVIKLAYNNQIFHS